MGLFIRQVLFILSILHTLVSVECRQHYYNKTDISQLSSQLQSTIQPSTFARETYLAGSSILYGILQKLNESNVDDACREHMQMIYDGLNQRAVWATKGNPATIKL